MRISGVIYPPSKKFPAFIPCWPQLNMIGVFTNTYIITGQRANGTFISYKELAYGIELKYLENGNHFYYNILYDRSLKFKQSYDTITKLFDFTHDNQILYYVPKTISIMFNYTNLRPSIENYVILCDIIDVCDIRGLIFSIWSHLLFADKNGYDLVGKYNDGPNQLWTLGELLLK